MSIYSTHTIWDGNLGEGTAGYAGYDRAYRVLVAGKPDLHGSADPLFRGDAARHNPEELFLAALSACHMLTVLALAARRGLRVQAYEDRASARLVDGRLDDIVLRPRAAGLSAGLHEEAHAACFLARSLAVPVRVEVLP